MIPEFDGSERTDMVGVTTRSRRLSILVLLIPICMAPGCGKGSKLQQIQDGARNVENHAREIENAARQAD